MKNKTRNEFTFTDAKMPVRFSKYMLLEQLGENPVGEEYLAAWGVDEGIDQLRVLNLVYPHVAEEEKFIALFSEEANAITRLLSTNIVRVMEVGKEGDIPFVATEYVEGLSLERLLQLSIEQKNIWPWEIAVYVVAEILRALNYVHQRKDIHGRPMGMRHGDVRPSNVLISSIGEVKLKGFGSSLYFIADEKTHSIIESFRAGYIPPDEKHVFEATVSGDLWGVGVILKGLLSGKIPSPSEKFTSFSFTPLPAGGNPTSIPDILNTFLARAFNPDPEYRFSSAHDMQKALGDIISEHVTGHPTDDLAAWVRDLGAKDLAQKDELIRNTLGKESNQDITGAQETEIGPGALIDNKYLLQRNIGEGGMGVVYEARHNVLDRNVAVKILHPEVLENKVMVERFKREAKITSALGHPNIVSVYDAGISREGYYYIAMELLEGTSLANIISKDNLHPKKLISILIEVCLGLQAAHDAGVVHRDIKPENIFLTSEKVCILDFGIAKSSELTKHASSLTKTGNLCGTVDYVSPEQLSGSEPSHLSDIYALGVILYEALTGTTPFRGRTVAETLTKILNEKLISPRNKTKDKTIPAPLEKICLKAMSKRPEQRFQSAGEFKQALSNLLPKETKDTDNKIKTPKKSRTSLYAALILIFVISGFVIYVYKSTGETGDKHGRDESRPYTGKNKSSGDIATAVSPDPTHKKTKTDGDIATAVSPSPNDTPPSPVKILEQPPASSGDKHGRDKSRLYTENTSTADTAKELFDLGKAAYEQQNLKDAIKNIRTALNYKNNPGWRILLGEIYEFAGQKKKAIYQWKKAIIQFPGNKKVVQNAKMRLIRAGEKVETEEK